MAPAVSGVAWRWRVRWRPAHWMACDDAAAGACSVCVRMASYNLVRQHGYWGQGLILRLPSPLHSCARSNFRNQIKKWEAEQEAAHNQKVKEQAQVR